MPARRSAHLLGFWLGLALIGCGPSSSSEQPAAAIARSLPGDLAALLPEGATLCHSESATEPINYQLWIFRRPESAYLEFPEKLPGLERHDMPASVLLRLIKAKAPWLDPGPANDGACRYTHWTSGDAELQVREITTPSGWYASIESIPIGEATRHP